MIQRLLLVDDDAVFRDRLARAFAGRGIDCSAAPDADAALALAREEAFDGAVVDLRMPGAGGLELVSALQRLRPKLAVVVLTGYGSIATALEAVRLGARDFLIKPADPDTLLAALAGERPQRPGIGEAPPEVPTLDRVEWEHIQRVLTETGGNISRTAQLLGIDRRSLQRKLGKYPPTR